MKPKLVLHKSQYEHGGSTLGMQELLQGIGNSGLFELEFHKENVDAMRGIRGSIIYYEGKKIYLDLWEYPTPTHTMEIYNANFDLIIKVQHKAIGPKQYNRYCRRKGLLSTLSNEDRIRYYEKIVPWTFFPSKMMVPFIGKENEQEPYPIERSCFFCGKAWRCRKLMKEALTQQGIECFSSNQELRRGKTLNKSEYLHYMRSSKYGLVLRGRSSMLTDSKNRREIDYMILKKPLLLDYEPFYYNPLKKGEHFILIDQNTKIDSLENMYNIEEIAKKGFEWYKQNATAEGMAQTFLQIMIDKFGKQGDK